MLPVSPCNSAGARLLLGLSLLIITSLALTPAPGEIQQSFNDKLGHALAFILLAFLVHASWPRLKFGWRQVGALLGYGIALEAAQYFIPNRYFSVLDMLADAAGIGIYMLLIPLIRRLLQAGTGSRAGISGSIR